MTTRNKSEDKRNRYEQLIEEIFFNHYKKGLAEFEFKREEIEETAKKLKITLPKNLGDVIYSFRYRASLPVRILQTSPKGKGWLIMPAGRSKYRFLLADQIEIAPNPHLAHIKIPDATPGIINSYALSDEQALLAKLRYNRLVDIFTRVTCYSLQNHLRTTVPNMGQVETDEIYVGVTRNGSHYAFPVQAKGGSDKLSVVQIQQDVGMCAHKFPNLICRPLGTQFIDDNTIAMFEFSETEEGLRIVCENHYKLVLPQDISDKDLSNYRKLQPDD